MILGRKITDVKVLFSLQLITGTYYQDDWSLLMLTLTTWPVFVSSIINLLVSPSFSISFSLKESTTCIPNIREVIAYLLKVGHPHFFLHFSIYLSCPILCDPMDCSPPGSSVHGSLQARILEVVAVSFSRGSSWPRDRTCISCDSCIARRSFTTEPPGKRLR